VKRIITILAVAALVATLISCGGGGAKISGTIRDSKTTDLLKDVTVLIGDQTLKSDEEGRFALDNLPKGKIDIELKLESFKTVTYPEFILNDGENFLEATMEKIPETDVNSGIKEYKDQPKIPGTPVKNRGKYKMLEKYDNCKVAFNIGDPKVNTMDQTYYFNNGTTRIVMTAASGPSNGEVIITKDVIYQLMPPQTQWMGVRLPKPDPKQPNQTPMPGPEETIKLMMKIVVESTNEAKAQVNTLGKQKFDGMDCEKYYVVGYASDITSSFDGEILVVPTGVNKGMIVSIVGKIILNGGGDQYSIQISQIGKVAKIDMPKNVKMQEPAINVTPIPPQEQPKNIIPPGKPGEAPTIIPENP